MGHHANYNPKYEECVLEDLIQESLPMPECVQQYIRFSCQGEGTPLVYEGQEIIEPHNNKDIVCGWRSTGPYPKYNVKKGHAIITYSNICTVLRQQALKPLAARRKGTFQNRFNSTSQLHSHTPLQDFSPQHLLSPLPGTIKSGRFDHLESCQTYREEKEQLSQTMSVRVGANGPVASLITETQNTFQRQIKHDLIKEMEKLRLKEQHLGTSQEVLTEIDNTNQNHGKHLDPEVRRLRHPNKMRRLGSKESQRSKPSTPTDTIHNLNISKTTLSISQDDEESIVIKTINGCVKPIRIPVLTCSLSFDYEKFRDRMKQLETQMNYEELHKNPSKEIYASVSTNENNGRSRQEISSAPLTETENGKFVKPKTENLYPNVTTHPPEVVAAYLRNHRGFPDPTDNAVLLDKTTSSTYRHGPIVNKKGEGVTKHGLYSGTTVQQKPKLKYSKHVSNRPSEDLESIKPSAHAVGTKTSWQHNKA